MILPGEPDLLMFHTDKKIKRKRKGVAHITEPEDKVYRISFHKRRRLSDKTSVPLGYINKHVGDTVI
jgi:hypothetical protein